MSETQLSEGGHVLVRGTLELTDEYKEIKQIVEIGRRLQVQLGLTENPRYTWSIFPDWRKVIEEDSKRKHDYMLALEMSPAMQFELIHHNYRFQLRNATEEVKLLKDKVVKLQAENLDVWEESRRLESRLAHLEHPDEDEGQR